MEDGVGLLCPHLDGCRLVGDFVFLCVGFSLIAAAFFAAAADGNDVRRVGGGVMWDVFVCMTKEMGQGCPLPVFCYLLPVFSESCIM